MKNRIMKRVAAVIVMLAICVTTVVTAQPGTAQAATKYITRANFIKLVLDEMGIKVDKNVKSPYVTKALELGLVNKNTFLSYNLNINKADAAIILVRADEYLNGIKVSDELVNEIIDSRISDITKVSKAKRPYLAKAYALGYIKGNSNGTYSTDRKMNPTYKITLAYAKQLVSMINKTDLRHEVSPDGQLIRTTNLSKYAKFYPYILASYPNSYYDWEFRYMRMIGGNSKQPLYGTSQFVNLINYAAPAEVTDYRKNELIYYTYKSNYRKKVAFIEAYNDNIELWEKNAREYLELVFNVSYKNINDKWLDKVLATTDDAGLDVSTNKNRLKQYKEDMIKNKTIVESKVIAVDKSSVYVYDNIIYIRAYVKYRVKSSQSLERETLSPIVYTRYNDPNFTNLKLNSWRDCYLDIEVDPGAENGGVVSAIINDYYHDNPVVMR